MKIYYLDMAFELLRKHKVVNSRSEFSEDWLGQNESYMRALHCRKAEPSLGVMAVCASRMQKAGERMVAIDKYRHVGERFLYVAEKCHELVNAEAVDLDLAA